LKIGAVIGPRPAPRGKGRDSIPVDAPWARALIAAADRNGRRRHISILLDSVEDEPRAINFKGRR
jgi:hypothetical protein